MGHAIFKNAPCRHYTDVFDVKILESRAKSFYKLKNVKLLKRYITGQREAEILNKKTHTKKKTLGLFTRKETDGAKKCCSVSGVSKVWDHRSLRYKIPSIDFGYRSSFADASVAKSF